MESETVRNIHLRREPHRAEYGALINKAMKLYEDPTRYPVQELIDLFALQREMMACQDDVQRKVLMDQFSQKTDSIHLLPDAPPRIYLWPEGNIPTETEYTENPGYIFDHDPGYEPYMLEMLVDESVEPIGAVVTIAGGSHGAGTINECYQIGKEFNALGYQAFILQCRPNGCPWSKLETATDAARALQIIRSNSTRYRVDPDKIALAGFSNGGVTCDFCIMYYSAGQMVRDYFPNYTPDEVDTYPGSPNAFICVYGPRHLGTEYNASNVQYPPTFFAVGRTDFVALDNLYGVLPFLWDRKTPVEIHTFAGHPHGYAGWKIIDGKGNPNFDLWVNHAACFLRDLFCGSSS